MFQKSAISVVLIIMLFLVCPDGVAQQPPMMPAIDKTPIALAGPNKIIISLGDKKLTVQQLLWKFPEPGAEDVKSLADNWLTGELVLKEAKRPQAGHFTQCLQNNAAAIIIWTNFYKIVFEETHYGCKSKYYRRGYSNGTFEV